MKNSGKKLTQTEGQTQTVSRETNRQTDRQIDRVLDKVEPTMWSGLALFPSRSP